MGWYKVWELNLRGIEHPLPFLKVRGAAGTQHILRLTFRNSNFTNAQQTDIVKSTGQILLAQLATSVAH